MPTNIGQIGKVSEAGAHTRAAMMNWKAHVPSKETDYYLGPIIGNTGPKVPYFHFFKRNKKDKSLH